MIHDLEWLKKGGHFPPRTEHERIQRYEENAALFDSRHFEPNQGNLTWSRAVFNKATSRISRVIGNWEEIISFPTLLNYQRLVSIKTADLVAGEYPTITAIGDTTSTKLKTRRDAVSFDAKLYATVIDLSRYGDAVWRVYKGEDGENTFTLWDPKEWLPIVAQDGTNTAKYHVLAWRENLQPEQQIPLYRLHLQIHGTSPGDIGTYEYRLYKLETDGRTIGELISTQQIPTGLKHCAIMHIKAFDRSDTIYGSDDYMPLDSLMAEIMARIGQISIILDKHSHPNMVGPASMLRSNPETGERYLHAGNFFAYSQGEGKPEYMTWDGQLAAAFKELELLINQLYILSEMGAALLGAAMDGGGQAISGTAMRFKMVNPLAKARRIANALTRPVRLLMEMVTGIPYQEVSVKWYDGLPDDPKENVEIAKLATGEQRMMPLKDAIMEYFEKSPEEAARWVTELAASVPTGDSNVNHPGPQDGTGVNSSRVGSETGLTRFHSPTNNPTGGED